MTISDLVKRLTNLYRDGVVNSSAQVKLATKINDWSERFDYFEIKVIDKDVYLVPTDVWDGKEKVERKPFYLGG
jgi:ribosome biogenesis protein Nip4